MKLNYLNRQTVDHTLLVVSQIQHGKHHLADVIERQRKIAPSPVKARAFWQAWKEMWIGTPFTQQGSFLKHAAVRWHSMV